jgi:TonB-linked SusC/RagA family outer membrane protein
MRLFILNLLFVLLSVSVFAQNSIEVIGKVTEATGEPIIGVSVVVKGTTQGTITDINGVYNIQNVPSDGIIVFSFIGFDTQEIPVNKQTNINLVLLESNTGLDEVVVIGYGYQKKADLTGSIGSVSSEVISKQPTLNAVQSVQGQIAGVNIINSDDPGSSPTVIIRGLGTALGGRDPLYIVDGFPVDDISNISSSDIVTMDVLKDASSASIYGVRAANGVILITTKKGEAGKPKVSFDSYIGVKGIQNQVKMANSDQYIEYFNEIQAALEDDWYLAENQTYNTDWYDELTDLGIFNNNTINLSGGSKNVDYFLSYNYYDEDGILNEQTYQRSTIRNNNVYRLFNDRLKISQNLNVSISKDNPKPYGAFNEAYRQSPLVPLKYENGRYGMPFVNTSTGIVTYEYETGESIGKLNSIGNPVFTVENTNELNKTLSLQGGFEAEFSITKNLKINSRLGATKYYSKNRVFNDIENAWLNSDPTRTEDEFEEYKTANPDVTTYAYNSLSITNVETLRWVWENYMTYNKDFNRHHIETTIGASREKTGIGSTYSATAYDVPDQEQYWNIDLASDDYEKEISQTSYTPSTLASYFGRLQYNFDSKYYATATVRRDGSSTFKDSGDYWGTFPSFGLGWTISKENFLVNIKNLDFLKLRGSWGKLGNQDVPLNVSQINTSTGSSNYNYVFGTDQDLVYGAAYGTPAVGLTWEVTEEWSIGADFSLLNYKLSGSIDYYNKTNTNTILYVAPTLDSEYSDYYYAHGAEVCNNGFEVFLKWEDKISNDLSYQISANYSYNKNKVTNVKSAYDGDTGGSLSNGQITKQLKEGQPIYAWYMYEVEGVWQTETEIDENPHVGSPLPGYLRYKDQNDDEDIDDQDKTFFGSYIPTSNYGIHLGIFYKKIDFNVDGYGVAGNKVYNGLKNARIDGGENIAYDTYKNRWTGEGSTNSDPGAARDSYASNYYLENGSFFRINNITLGYTLDNIVLTQSKLRFYFTTQNPFMFTNYSGFTPEISSDGNPSGTTGIELSAYPTTRNFILGVNFQF